MKILVVDREEDTRKVIDILEQTPGNEVQSALTGQEAIDMTQGRQVDLLITEVFLEPMNGFTLRNKMENRHAGVRTIFVSGYDLSSYTEHTAGYEIVAKPATPQKLFPAIARTMAGGGRALEAAPAQAAPAPKAQEEAPPQQPAPVPVAAPNVAAAPAAPAAQPAALPRVAATPVAQPAAAPRVTIAPGAQPAGIPRVTAVPGAQPAAVPRVAAAPVAQSVAAPRFARVPAAEQAAAPKVTAAPVAQSVAVPRVTAAPAANQQASPRVTAVPAPQAAPVPRVTAGPVAEQPAAPRVMATPVAQPVAVPRVTATPAAEQAATPRVMATPVAQPVAVPRVMAAPVDEPAPAPSATATPVAAPGLAPTDAVAPAADQAATPRVMATPVAQPVAVPRVMAVPVDEPVPAPSAAATPAAAPGLAPTDAMAPAAEQAAAPRVMATPVAQPVAVPRVTAAPANEAATAPRLKAVPVNEPAIAPRVTAMPRPTATPASLPKLTGAPRAAIPANRTAEPVRVARAAPAAVPDPFLGKTLGSYRIERRLGRGKWGPVYLAIQTSMNRPVAMEMLAPEKAGEEAARQNFVATARAKAAVQHPHILSVYEADQAEGHYFYTHEYVDGFTLAQLAAKGEGLSEPTALQTIKYVAQGLSHLHHHKIAHSIPDATDIYIGTDGLPYLSNVALPTEDMPAMQEEICTLGRVIQSVLPGGQAQDRGLQAMLTRMAITNQLGFQSWPPLFQAIQAIEPKVVPADAFKLSAQDQAAIRAVEAARKRQKMVVTASVAGLVLFLAVIAGVVWWEFLRPETHDYSDDMVRIDAGDFIYQDGQKLTLPTFYIDKYEVTMAEYEKFLDYLKAHGNPTTYDSELQPPGRSHVPRDWDIYYGRASSEFPGYRTVRNVPITLDCPVFNVDYFDAYAYAKWKGRRLPTQQEWEKAARGPSGNLYPWGNQWDPAKLNAGGDYQAEPQPGYKPLVDGFTCWAPVDAIPGDRSPYGVIGLAGNVSEWTNSWDPSKTYVFIRGGNYKSTSEQALATGFIKVYPQQVAETLGFRTASDNPPAK